MIRLFISDIDGCLSVPYQPYRLDILGEITALAARSVTDEIIPLFSICTGRAYPYAEAMTQLLGLRMPILFEAGGGMFDPVAARSRWHPAFTGEVRDQVDRMRNFMAELVDGTAMSVDYAKRSQAAMVATDSKDLRDALDAVEEFVCEQFPRFHVYDTPVSIDVVFEDLSKKSGIEWLMGEMDLEWSEVAFIGDTNGDIEALRSAGRSFAPSNAMPEVHRIVDFVTDGSDADGVLESYRLCIEDNRLNAKRREA